MLKPPSPSSLTPLQRFSLISLCALVLFGLLFGLLVTRSIEQNMLERSRQLSAEYISKVVSSEFTPQELSTPRSESDYTAFASKIGKIVLGPQVVRAKFWNNKRQIVWSDDPKLVGKVFKDNDELEDALKGKVTSELSGLEKKEHASEKQHGALLELYVPIKLAASGEVIAVVEVYQKLGNLLDDVSRQKRQVWLATSVGFLLLYILLFGVFRQATLRIERQHVEKIAFQKRLIEAERQQMVTTIAASIGHELNNTLTSMLLFSEMTQVPNPSTELLQRFARSMPPLIQRLTSFGKNLMTIGHPPKPVFVPLDINDLLKRVTELLTESGMLKKFEVKLDLSPGFVYVHGDRGMLEQVITNLVINSSHAMENGGTLTIRSIFSQSTDFVSVEIADTGHGIPEENLEKIFEPFFTTKAPGKENWPRHVCSKADH
jgi:signal transduction histidine kinase